MMKNVKLCRLIKNVLRKNKIFVYCIYIMPKDENILRFQSPGRRPGTRRAGWLHNYGTGAAHERRQEHAPQTKAGAVGAAVMRRYYNEDFTFLLRCILKAAQFVLIGKFALSGAVGVLTGLKKYDDAMKLAREWRWGGWLRSDAGFGVLNPRGRSALLNALEFLKQTGEVPAMAVANAERLLEQVTAGSVGAVGGMTKQAVGYHVVRKAWEHRHDWRWLTKIFLDVTEENKENVEKVAAAEGGHGDLKEILSPPLIPPNAEWGEKLRVEAYKGWRCGQRTYGPHPAGTQLLEAKDLEQNAPRVALQDKEDEEERRKASARRSAAARRRQLRGRLDPPLNKLNAKWGDKLRKEAYKGWRCGQRTYGPYPAGTQLLAAQALADEEAHQNHLKHLSATPDAHVEAYQNHLKRLSATPDAHVEAYQNHLERRSAAPPGAHPPRFSQPGRQAPDSPSATRSGGGKKTKHKRKNRNRCASKKYKKSSKRKSRCCASKKHRRSSKSKRSPTRRSRM
jgi:hypothetical protein